MTERRGARGVERWVSLRRNWRVRWPLSLLGLSSLTRAGEVLDGVDGMWGVVGVGGGLEDIVVVSGW